MSSIDQEFVEFIAKSLVTKPDAVSIERRIDERGVLLELTVDPEDLGRVIGKHGATAQSLRTLLRALGTKNDARYNLKIVDSDRPEGERSAPAPRREEKPREESAPAPEQIETPSEESPKEDIMAKEVELDEVWGKEETPAEKEESDEHDDMVSKTRKELAELDDLDV
ncbi:MAG: KH domain-containing protein [bacterium]